MENLNYFVFAVSVVSQYVSRQKVFKIALDTGIWPTWPFSHIATILKEEKSQLWLSHLPSKTKPQNEAHPKKSKANPIFLPPGTAQSAWYSPAEQGSAFLAPLCCPSPPPGLFSFSWFPLLSSSNPPQAHESWAQQRGPWCWSSSCGSSTSLRWRLSPGQAKLHKSHLNRDTW